MSTSDTPNRSPLRALDYAALQQCMHCGMCLPTCPTYAETGLERHSPRGRIALMRSIADGDLEPTRTFADEMYHCLGCLACTSACPAGVDYAHLFEVARIEAERSGQLDSTQRRAVRAFSLRLLFTRPRLLRLAGLALRIWQRTGLETLFRRLRLNRLLPGRLKRLEPQAPRIAGAFSDSLIDEFEPASAPRRYRVAVLTGCVQDLVFSDINRATVDVLRANGCDVVTPRNQSCCGSLHAHNGDLDAAKLLARRQLDEINPAEFDAIISNAGGCGSHLRHYDRLLADDPVYAERARLWSTRLRDIHEWLVEIGFRKPVRRAAAKAQGVPLLTYHESCHLAHGQKISSQPREILRALPGFDFVELKEATWCCGSAGIYNITQPEMAAKLQDRKITHLRATQATVIATANPGCHIQIVNGFPREAGAPPPRVVHPVVLLAEAYANEGGQSRTFVAGNGAATRVAQ